jgi:hypothetical protein
MIAAGGCGSDVAIQTRSVTLPTLRMCASAGRPAIVLCARTPPSDACRGLVVVAVAAALPRPARALVLARTAAGIALAIIAFSAVWSARADFNRSVLNEWCM